MQVITQSSILALWVCALTFVTAQAIRCELDLPATRGTRYTPPYKSRFLPDEQLNVDCDSDYWNKDSHQSQEIITCQETGLWSMTPECEEITCNDPQDSSVYSPRRWNMGRVRGTQYYSCRTGYKAMARQATCTKTGWTPNPLCEEITCDQPEIPNAEIEPHTHPYMYGDRLFYKCKNGYSPQERKMAVCEENGWDTLFTCTGWVSPPEASEIQCGHPPEVGSAIDDMVYQNIVYQLYGDGRYEVEYTCRESFMMVGPRKITCSKGKWSAPPPECIRECLPIPRVENAEHSVMNYKPGTTTAIEVSYQCPRLYLLSFDHSVKCTDGRWEPAPVCYKPCTVTEADMEKRNIRFAYTVTAKLYAEHGDFISFRCVLGTSFIDPGQRRQCRNGEVDLPSCL